MKSLAIVLLVLPAVAFGAIVFGGADTAKTCEDALLGGGVKESVADPNDCSQYYICSIWFQSKMKCKDGEHFSVAEEKCTDPCLAGCDTSIDCSTTAAPTEAPAPAEEEAAAPAEEAEAVVAEEAAAAPAEEAEAVPAEEAAAAPAEDAEAAPAEEAAAAPAEEAEAVPAEEAAAPDVEAEGAADEAEDDVDVTTPAFWVAIAKFFNTPPATIPGVTGTIPSNF